MNFYDDIIDTLREIAIDMDVDEEVLSKCLEEALLNTLKKVHGRVDGIDVSIESKGKINSTIDLEVVNIVEEPDLEINIEEAREINPNVLIGDIVKKKIDINQLSRSSILSIRTILGQKISDAEKDRVVLEYSSKINEIVSGTVQQIGRSSIIVDLGIAEGVLSLKDQIPTEKWHPNQRIKGLVVEIQEKGKTPYIALSRSSNKFLYQLFKNEVPEIYDGIIKIISIAREPGERAKIAVWSRDERIDAAGACIGMKGYRVQAIVKEINGEKIDIVIWDNDPVIFISRALSPAQIEKINLDKETKKATVIVSDDQKSLTIGNKGQNAKLASILTGWKIDVFKISEISEQRKDIALKKLSIDDLKSIDKKAKKKLKKNFKNLYLLKEISDEDLLKLLDGNEEILLQVRKSTSECLEIF